MNNNNHNSGGGGAWSWSSSGNNGNFFGGGGGGSYFFGEGGPSFPDTFPSAEEVFGPKVGHGFACGDIVITEQNGEFWTVNNRKTGDVLKFDARFKNIMLNDTKLTEGNAIKYIQQPPTTLQDVIFELRQPPREGFDLPNNATRTTNFDRLSFQ